MVSALKTLLYQLNFLLLLHYGKTASCGGITYFEKIPNTFSTEAIATLFSGFQGQPITADCLGLCRQSHECVGFVVDYSSEKCLSVLSSSSTLEESFQTRQGFNFFKKICLESVPSSCNTLFPWIIEKIRGFRPQLPVAHQYNNVNTSDGCSALCLAEKSFSCYSATHLVDRGICLLHMEHVTSYPYDLQQEDPNKVHHIENLCSTKISNDCHYFSRANATIGTVDAITNANSRQECEKACDRSSRTVCRSYGFERSTRSCALSGDGLVVGLPNIGMIVGERSCVPESCSRESLFYERTIGSTLRNIGSQSPEKASPRELVSTCLERCRALGSGCSAVVVDHSKVQCQIFQQNSKSPGAIVTPSPIHSLFEQVCLPAARDVCRDKAWIFERVPNHEMKAPGQSRLISKVLYRSDCEDACLRETTFQCRSANFDALNSECTLNADDRRTQPQSLVASDRNIEYLENQCLLPPSTCPFVRQENGFPTYIDAIQAPVTSEEQCKQACISVSSFTCRAAGFRVTTSECLLSGIDQVSGGQEAIQNRLGTSYFQRQCPAQESVTLQPNADFSPFPTFSHHSEPTKDPKTTITTAASTTITAGEFAEPLSVARACPRNYSFATYEKTTGYELNYANPVSLFSSQTPGITEQCVERCLLDAHCQGFTLDYANIRCFTGSVGNKTKFDLERVSSHSFYELLCLSESRGCGMLWSFERFMNYGMTSHFLTLIPQVSKIFCEDRCLNETRFVCRSATYDYNTMECRLSAENRFTKPEAFKALNNTDYIENQCAELFTNASAEKVEVTTPTSSPVTPSISPRDSRDPCYFSNRIAGKFLKISDRSIHTQSEKECADACLLSKNFICQSYSYLPKSSGYSDCLLSSGTARSLGIRLQDIEKAVYVEKICENIDRSASSPNEDDSSDVIVVPLPFTTTRLPCTTIDYSLERTTGVAPINQSLATPLASSSTTDCVRECVGDRSSCMAFVQTMGEVRCQSFSRPFEPFELTITPGAIYYEKICLKAFACGKLWVFERVMGHELIGNDNRVLNDVISREECEDWCLREGAFICRSAEYDYVTKQCRLSKESRHSQPKDFRVSGSHIDYMENQCSSS